MSRRLVIPGLRQLQDLRHLYARGGLPPSDTRTPEDWCRITAFRVVEELLRLLEDYRRRSEEGERCRLVERPHATERGRLRLELVIEGMEESR